MAFSVPDYISSMKPYIPGKPIEETQREYQIKKVIKLASNENPLGPSPKALRLGAKTLKQLHLYPDGSAFRLRNALAKHLKLSPQYIFPAHGSNEVIDLVIRTFCVPGDVMVTSQTAFIIFKLCAQIHGVKTIETPVGPDLKFDLDRMYQEIQSNAKVRVVFVANPNNPTGTYVNTNELRSFLKKISQVRGGNVLVVLDYAYWEYITVSDLPDATELMHEFSNVIVMRTFSKIYGLAGLRVGYAIAQPEIISYLDRVRQPFNVNSFALALAEEALKDQAFVKKTKQLNVKSLKFWERQLERLEVPYWKSQGNFILVDIQKASGKSGPEIYELCLRKGVIFRPIASYGMPQALRISTGTDEENKFAVRVLEEVLNSIKKGGKR